MSSYKKSHDCMLVSLFVTDAFRLSLANSQIDGHRPRIPESIFPCTDVRWAKPRANSTWHNVLFSVPAHSYSSNVEVIDTCVEGWADVPNQGIRRSYSYRWKDSLGKMTNREKKDAAEVGMENSVSAIYMFADNIENLMILIIFYKFAWVIWKFYSFAWV